MSAELVASAHKIVLISLPRVRACLGFDGAILIERGPEAWALRTAVRGILRPLMEKWPPSSGAAIVWKFSLRSLPAAGLRTQRQSLVPLATEERWLADPHSAMSAARFAHQEILTHRGARRVCFC